MANIGSRSVVRTTLIVSATVFSVLLLLLAIYSARWPLLLASIGIGIGVLISPTVHLLHRKAKIPKGITGTLFLFLWAAGIFGTGYLIYLLVSGQLSQLSENFPTLLNSGKQKLALLFEKIPFLSSTIRKFNWGGIAGNSMGSLAHGIQISTEVLAALIYVIAVSIYTATSRERYLSSILSLVPAAKHEGLRKVLEKSASALRSWFIAQLIAMACVGACASIGFLIIGINYWLVLGILTAILDIVPFVGPTVAAICACMVTLGSDPEKVPWIILNFIVVEHIESNLVVPLVLKGKIDLPPVHLLTMMLIFGSWFGVLGILVAPPLLAVLRAIYLMVYIPSINGGQVKVDEKKVA
jgi:predicted PurR-regulated permease PerM